MQAEPVEHQLRTVTGRRGLRAALAPGLAARVVLAMAFDAGFRMALLARSTVAELAFFIDFAAATAIGDFAAVISATAASSTIAAEASDAVFTASRRKRSDFHWRFCSARAASQ